MEQLSPSAINPDLAQGRAPAVFVSHGSPMTALENGAYPKALRKFAASRPRPSGIVVISGHWEQGPPLGATAWTQHELIYDFFGFPQELYEIQYPAAGEPKLAAEVTRLLGEHSIECRPQVNRGLDHGAWVPLRFLYPDADVPVVALSQPQVRSPRQLFRLGEILKPLREAGVMILGSGGLVHNLRLIQRIPNAPPEAWAVEFDQWFKKRLEARDWEEIFAYREKAPHARQAAPTTEHFDPLFIALGASSPADDLLHIYEGIELGNMSLRSFALA